MNRIQRPPVENVFVDDNDLIERSLDQPAVFGEIFERHFRKVHGYLARLAGTQVADDLAAETFAAAFAGRHRFDLSYPSALPWLLGIATNVLRGDRRAKARSRQLLERIEVPAHAGFEEGAVLAMDARRQVRRLGPLFSRLSDDDTATLLLYAWEDLTYEQVAQALQVPVGTVRSRLNRVRRTAAQIVPSAVDGMEEDR